MDRERREAEAEADGRVLNSVLRLRILRLCLDEPLTNKQVAARLGKDPATVYHHVRRLADRGFLAAQPERTGARGAREVPYLATKKSWRTPLPDGGSRLLVETFLAELAEADPQTVSTTRLGLRLSPQARDELLTRLHAVFQEYADRPPDPDGTPWSVFLAVHEDSQRAEPGGDRGGVPR
ncbi:helix-turn-helix domain-containing protein [Isoptericola sp. b441]|uniref:Helix-turn-helix domain-containing protein n=1 Tax=Actinotalea lenta TaxID=3064654 RepID=A0ABT9D9G0_9CELL|nr:helix-turn-helix domain-containing protein [Isoptericola sp. b441]MDO8105597.1 helix-turn-helix domain-containing protein [Isoptericola sp. b441]